MIGRIATALETIASELRELRITIQAMHLGQKEAIERSRQEAEKGPAQIADILEQARAFIGGTKDGR
jgi:hypothetical protein